MSERFFVRYLRHVGNGMRSAGPSFCFLVVCFLAVGLLTAAGCSNSATTTPAATPTASESSAKNRSDSVKIVAGSFEFAAPVRLTTEEGPVRVEAPGYAAPCWADVDRDGKKDLLVGQFNGGKIRVYKNLGETKLAPGEWLRAGEEIAQVPGVW